MKNREVLSKICMYDLLCRINDGIPKNTHCVLDMLEKGHFKRRCHEYATCEDCLSDWMNEETKLALNERKST